ncbi:hypothetical protein GCWU000341_00897 [Oribacterium sp. oral taxon 078 str. F0262]|nr:hypothetical protein GCWU000341_00897 [Oribacterium sp. oral taxon 078 str. F0262]
MLHDSVPPFRMVLFYYCIIKADTSLIGKQVEREVKMAQSMR